MKRTAFSKKLLVQESVLIWILSVAFVVLAFICVFNGYTGSLPWLAVTLTGAWTAYGVSQNAYYKKSTVENSKGGIVYETSVPAPQARKDCE